MQESIPHTFWHMVFVPHGISLKEHPINLTIKYENLTIQRTESKMFTSGVRGIKISCNPAWATHGQRIRLFLNTPLEF